MSKQETWIHLHTTQVIPGIESQPFDKSFKNISDHSLIAKDLPLTSSKGEDIFKISDQGRKAFKNEKRLRRKPFKDKHWLWYEIIKILMALTAGYFFRVITEPKQQYNNREANKINSERPPDSSNKK